MRFKKNIMNPLVILPAVLAYISCLTGDMLLSGMIILMIMIGVVLRLFQELRADNAAEKLKAMICNKALVIRNNKEIEIPVKLPVPGDMMRLSAGDMIPADVKVLSAKDLFINQATLISDLRQYKNPQCIILYYI
jgi:Mg2+-importing ATPase